MLNNFPIKTIVLVALPGSGKTSLVRKLRSSIGDNAAVDLDYKGTKHTSDKIVALHTRLVNEYSNLGARVVTTFDGYIGPLNLQTGTLCIYCLPKNIASLTNAVKCRGDRPEFIQEYSEHGQEWLETWERKVNLYSRFPAAGCASLTVPAYIDFSEDFHLSDWFEKLVPFLNDFLNDKYLDKLNKEGPECFMGIPKLQLDRIRDWWRFLRDVGVVGE